MARKCKCNYCGKQLTTDNAVFYEVFMSNNKSKKVYFCNYEEMRQNRIDQECWKNSLLAVDVLAGEKIPPTSKNKKLKAILDMGYTKQDLYMTLCELKSSISMSLKMRYDIENGYQKLSYIVAAIENNIERVHRENTVVETENKYIPKVEELKPQEKLPVKKKKTLKDRIKGGNNGQKLQSNN